MSRYLATIAWQRDSGDFCAGRYSRAHHWRFDGGLEIAASSSPQVVPLPYSSAAAIDPEEALVASLASCHMLWFLSLAAKAGIVVEQYADEAIGTMGPDATGKLAMLEVVLRPGVTFSGTPPGEEQSQALHHAAHEACFIANSVKTQVRCEPVQAST